MRPSQPFCLHSMICFTLWLEIMCSFVSTQIHKKNLVMYFWSVSNRVGKKKIQPVNSVNLLLAITAPEQRKIDGDL